MCSGRICKILKNPAALLLNTYSLPDWCLLQQRATKRALCLVATLPCRDDNGKDNSGLKFGDALTRLGTNSRQLFGMSSGCCLFHLRRTLTSAFILSSASISTDRPGWYDCLADSAPIRLTQDFLVGVQQLSGLPWWASIICSTIAIRAVITLPLAAYQLYVIAKIENLQPEIENLAKRLRYEVSFHAKQRGWSEKLARFHFKKNLRRIISELYVRDNCHPFKASLLIWVQIPLWVFVSIALRNLSLGITSLETAVQTGLAVGGTLWFPNLTFPDSTWILPVSLGLINLLIVEISTLRKTELSKYQKCTTYLIRGISLVMIPIAATVPSSMSLYWFTSSIVGLGQNLLMCSPSFRHLCRIPKIKSYSDVIKLTRQQKG